MYETILLPTDGSDVATAAADAAVAIAAQHGATLHIVTALELGDLPPGATDAAASDFATDGTEAVAAAAAAAQERGVPTETASIEAGGAVHEAIVAYAGTHGVDCIVMGTNGRTGIDRFVLGSVAERTVRDAPMPVLTLHAEATVDPAFPSLLVPTDGSDAAAAALDHAIDLARATDASIHLLHVVDAAMTWGELDTVRFMDTLEEMGEDLLAERAATAREAGVAAVETSLVSGTPHREIREGAADLGVSCVVMGTHGRSGLDRYLLGSVTERVLRTCETPVLTVGQGAD